MFGKLGNIANTFLHAFEQIKSTTQNLTASFRTPNFNNTSGQNAALEHLAMNFNPSSATVAQQNKAVQNGGFKNLNLNDFISVERGSNSHAAIVIGTSEGTRKANGDFLPAYGKHNDPGDGKINIGSFSYNAERRGIPVSGPEEADRVILRDMNGVRANYENKVRAAGLDPNNSLLASAYFDEYVQSPRSAGRFLSPENLAYLKQNGINQQTISEARFRSWINPQTGQLYRTAKGGYVATGFVNMAKEHFGVKNPTEEQIQYTARADQARRIGKIVEALKAQGFTDNLVTPTAPTRPTAPTSPPTTTAPSNKPVPATTSLPVPAAGLERGDHGQSVKQLQNALVKLGFMIRKQVNTGPGTFGPRTERSLRAFQQAHGLKPDGVYGAKTREALRTALGGISTPSQPTAPRAPEGPTTSAPAPNVPTTPASNNSGSGTKPTVSRRFTELTDAPNPKDNGHYMVTISGVGTVRVTEGFLVHGPHSVKNGIQAIMNDGTLRQVNGKVNLGIDYVVQNPNKRVKNWFGGEVVKAEPKSTGYGNRVIVKTDLTYNFNGKNYQVYTHYAHLDRIDVRENQRIEVGDSIGIMGNTGGSHGAHVDQRFWIETPQGKIDLSPNLLVNVK